ncbi:MAG: methionyl-tRNA formyltransferase [bacterium]
MIQKILKDKDPILRKPADDVTSFDFDLQKTIDDMIDTMRHTKGVGLAAPQIGVSKKIFICEFNDETDTKIKPFPLTVFCNPQIIDSSKKQINMVEGCLSFPGLEILVKRPESVTIRATDRYGKPIEFKADNLFARVIQHEYDHLHSTLLIDHIQETKVVFIGTGNLGQYALEDLTNDPQYKIGLVVTGNSQSTSRNHSEKNINPIELLARHFNLPMIKTSNINDPEIIAKINKINPDLGVMADFGQIIPAAILNIPRHGILNIHPSLLPKYRGPSPIQQTILNGDEMTGVTIIRTGERMDAGDIISQAKVKLTQSETSSILKDYLAQLGANLLMNSIPYYLAGDLEPYAQDEKGLSFTTKFKKEDGFVDETTPAVVVERKIRAFDQWPKVYTISKGKRIQITAAHFAIDHNLVIDRVKPEGSKEMNYTDFQNGYKTTLTFVS